MKKLLLALAFVGACVLPAKATFDGIDDRAVTVAYNLELSAAATSTTTLIIDLSDTANWPHKETGGLVIGNVRVELDKAAASTTTVRLGVVNFVNTSTGSVTWVWSNKNRLNVSNTNTGGLNNYYPIPLRLRVKPNATPAMNGSTPYVLSNDTTSGSTTFQTDVTLASPNGHTTPGVGDLVLDLTRGNVAVNLHIEVQYYAER